MKYEKGMRKKGSRDPHVQLCALLLEVLENVHKVVVSSDVSEVPARLVGGVEVNLVLVNVLAQVIHITTLHNPPNITHADTEEEAKKAFAHTSTHSKQGRKQHLLNDI